MATITFSKTKCSKCGNDKLVNPKALEARIKKYGSLEEIEKQWVCRECLTGKVRVKKEKKKKEPRVETTVEAIKNEAPAEVIVRELEDVYTGPNSPLQ